EGAYQKSLTSSQMIAKSHGLTPDQTPAMTKDGTVTTLDKVMSGNSALPQKTESKSGNAATSIPTGNVMVKLPNGQQGHVSSANLARFLKDHPGSSQVQQ
ncbi:MAG TPA: hypothetical protein VFC46_04400, partial [Humisphaera sp.]|nr:hypothetical protein [Humisphaera sp.]